MHAETEKLARRFKEWRTESKLTLRGVEALTGISNAFLSQFETGQSEISYERAKILEKLIEPRDKLDMIKFCIGRLAYLIGELP